MKPEEVDAGQPQPHPSSLLRLPAAEYNVLDRGLKRAILEFERNTSAGPYPVASGIYANVFESWVATQENCWRLGFVAAGEHEAGIVHLFGDPSLLHERVSCKLASEFILQLKEVVADPYDIVEPVGSTRYTIKLPGGGYLSKEPDGGLVPAMWDKSFPTFVVEVAYKNESYNLLEKEIKWWSLGGAPVVMGLKVDSRKKEYLLVIADHEVGTNNLEEINFSPDVVTGMGQRTIKIPLKKIMRGACVEEALSDFLFVLDLYTVQRWIQRAEEHDVPSIPGTV